MKKIILLIGFFISFIASFSVMANASIFGLTLGQTSIKELKKEYRVQNTGINKYNQGEMYSIPPSQINFDGLESVTTIFNKSGKLVAVLTEFPKSKFDYLNSVLSKKYHLVSQDIPFVGNKRVNYRDGMTEINLDAPHMSFELSMNYINDDFNKTYNNEIQRETSKKTQQESSML